MAPKQKQRPPPIDDPPTASSSSSDEEEEQQQPSSQQHNAEEVASSSEEEASSEEEEYEEQEPSTPNPSSKPASSTNPQPKPSSSDSESDSESDKHPPKVKPLPSKPIDQVQVQKPKAQPKSGSKRAVENNNNAHVSDPKRAKTKVTELSASDEEDGKKGSKKLFQRLWSEEDELAILKGMVEFTSKTGQDPQKYPDAFHDFMKKSLHVDASSNQLKEKMRRLKKKFSNNAVKEKPRFSKPHDQKAFELSKKVWGSEQVEKVNSDVKPAKSPKKEAGNRNVASAKKTKLEKKPVPPDSEDSKKKDVEQRVDTDDSSLLLSEMSHLQNGVVVCGLSEDQLKRGLELIGESKRVELERKLKKLRTDELELFANRALLIGEVALLILEALKSPNH